MFFFFFHVSCIIYLLLIRYLLTEKEILSAYKTMHYNDFVLCWMFLPLKYNGSVAFTKVVIISMLRAVLDQPISASELCSLADLEIWSS